MNEQLKCTKCGKDIPPMIDSTPTHYDKGVGDKITEILCVVCYTENLKRKLELMEDSVVIYRLTRDSL